MSVLDRNLADRLLVVNDEHETETERLYQLPPETVTDPRVNREKQAEIEERLNLMDRDLEAYERDLQRLEALEVQDPTHPSRQLPTFRRGKQRLKDAIASLKSAQVQLQQQCTSAHMALFKMIENEEQEAIETLLEDPELDVNGRDENETVFLTLLGDPRFDVNGGDPDTRSLLHTAVMRRNIHIVRKLLELNADTSCNRNRRYMPLHDAALYGYTDMVTILLQCGRDVVDQEDTTGQTPLHHAAQSEADTGPDVVRMLLRNNANVYKRDNKGHTPLYGATGPDDVPEETVIILLENTQIINESNDSSTQSILNEAILNGYSIPILKMLLAKGATVDGEDEEGEAPLEWIKGMSKKNTAYAKEVVKLLSKK
jgi:ankyrin repeat protein